MRTPVADQLVDQCVYQRVVATGHSRGALRLRLAASGILVGATIVSPATPAAQPDSLWTLGVTGGTLGVGPEIGVRTGPYFGLRANAGFLSTGRDETVDQITYNGTLKLNSFGLSADWYPTGSGWRVSVGARRNDNKIDLNGTPGTSVTVGNHVYTPTQLGSLVGTVTTNEFAPTVSLGYGGTLAKGLTLGAEFGVLFQGTPKVENFHATGLAANPIFQSDLQAERARVEDKVHNYRYWPVAQLELLYRF
jgi:hypothetical protein